MFDKKFDELKSLFVLNPSKAITESQKIICSVSNFNSYEQFFTYHLKNPHMSTCQREWSKPQMSVHCFDCGVDPQSCICLQCFLNGNHQGHEYFIYSDSTGNCDCGDSSLWKQTGFCKEHQGLNDNDNPENYLDEKLRNALTDVIFKAAFSSLDQLKRGNDHKVSSIFQFVSSFLQFGDGFRRLIAISLTERIDFKTLLSHISEYSYQFNRLLQQLCGGLINDQLFKVNFGIVNFNHLVTETIPFMLKRLVDKADSDNCSNWDDFWFQSFALEPIKTIIERKKFNWVLFILQFTKYMKQFFNFKGIVSINGNIPSIFSDISMNLHFMSQVQPNEETQLLFDELFTKVLNCGANEDDNINNTILPASFIEIHDDFYYDSNYVFYFVFYNLLQCFKLKKKLNLMKLFIELNETIDISPIFCVNYNEFGDENDLFISKFIEKVDDLSKIENKNESIFYVPVENNFKSFHNGGSFFFSYPLFDSLCYLFKLDNLMRVKIARILKLERFKKLRIQLGIVALKKIIALICCHQSLVPLSNFGLISFLVTLTKNPNFIHLGIPRIFPLFQLLIGLENEEKESLNEFSIKEFFAFEMAREFGIFDDFTSKDYSDENVDEKQKQMIFSFLYTSLLLIIERNLFNYNGYYFMEEQIIFALKMGNSSLSKLDDMYSVDAAREGKHHLDFNTILLNVATTNKKKKIDGNDGAKVEKNNLNVNVSFTLKEGVEWRPISAINPINDNKTLMNNEIKKNPNSLLKIPDFEDEDNYFFNPSKCEDANPEIKDDEKEEIEKLADSTGLNIRLKEFLSTPTVLAVIYQTIRSSGEKVELNDHLAMNILILISKFAKEEADSSSSSSTFDSSLTIQYDSTVIDLISKFKRTLFDFKINEDGSASIKNSINKQNFKNLLNMKITSGTDEPKSFIDILISKGEIGKNVLNQMSIDFEIKSEQIEKKSTKEINKQRANKLKESIINQYKNLINNYSVSNNDLIEQENSNDDDDENENEDDEVCSICASTRNDQALSYPVYIYRTKFPFIVDKPPISTIREGEEIPVDEDNDDELTNEENIEHEFDYNEEEEEEEEEEEAEEEEEEEEEENEGSSSLSSNRRGFVRSLFNSFMLNKNKKEEIEEEVEKVEPQIDEAKEVQKRVTAGKNFVVQFCICQHPIHPTCVNKKAFKCPIDRSFKNGFLPCLDSIQPSSIIADQKDNDDDNDDDDKQFCIQKTIQDSIDCFIDNFASICGIQKENKPSLIIELVKSISGLIATSEVRLRSLPDCLDSNKTKLLSRNLFLTTWYCYRISGKPQIESELIQKLTLFQKFILKLIESDELEKNNNNNNENKKIEFMKIFQFFMNSKSWTCEVNDIRKEKEIFLFLRRVCLSDFFLLNGEIEGNQKQAKIIDWDEILSVSNLMQRYGIQLNFLKGKTENDEDFEFKPIVFTKLPKEFLRFALKPFNFPVEKTSKFTVYDILDYNNLIKNHDDFKDSDDDDDDDDENELNLMNQLKSGSSRKMNKMFRNFYSRKNYPSVLLLIGRYSSCIVVISHSRMVLMNPFYLDKFGCNDIEYKRGQPLFFNEEKYERFMDEIMSGNFSNDLYHFIYL